MSEHGLGWSGGGHGTLASKLPRTGIKQLVRMLPAPYQTDERMVGEVARIVKAVFKIVPWRIEWCEVESPIGILLRAGLRHENARITRLEVTC